MFNHLNSYIFCCYIISQWAPWLPNFRRVCSLLDSCYPFHPWRRKTAERRLLSRQDAATVLSAHAAWEAPERSSLLPEQWLPCSPLIDPPLGRLWRGKTTCWLHAYNLLRSLSLWQPAVVPCMFLQVHSNLFEIGREECGNNVRTKQKKGLHIRFMCLLPTCDLI